MFNVSVSIYLTFSSPDHQYSNGNIFPTWLKNIALLQTKEWMLEQQVKQHEIYCREVYQEVIPAKSKF